MVTEFCRARVLGCAQCRCSLLCEEISECAFAKPRRDQPHSNRVERDVQNHAARFIYRTQVRADWIEKKILSTIEVGCRHRKQPAGPSPHRLQTTKGRLPVSELTLPQPGNHRQPQVWGCPIRRGAQCLDRSVPRCAAHRELPERGFAALDRRCARLPPHNPAARRV